MKYEAELTRLLHALCEGIIAPDEAQRLNDILAEDKNARIFYMQYIDLHAALARSVAQKGHGPNDRPRSHDSSILLEAVAIDMAANARRDAKIAEARAAKRAEAIERQKAMRILAGLDQPKSKSIHHYVIPRVLAYGAVAAAVAMVLTLIYALQPDPSVPQAPPAMAGPVEEAVQRVAVATLIDSRRLQFADGDINPLVGSTILSGRYTLTRGMAKFEFNHGALMTVVAPATIELIDDATARLDRGHIVGRCPKGAEGFSVRTPTAQIVDLGTEFGVAVDESGQTDVHVFVGRVQLDAGRADEPLRTVAQIAAGHAQRVDESTAVATIPLDGMAFADAEPHLALLRRNLVINGDFEADRVDAAGLTDPGQNPVDITGWVDETLATVVEYESPNARASGYPDPADRSAVPTNRGRYFFMGVEAGSVWQSIDVKPLAMLIDEGRIDCDLSAWIGGYSTHTDSTDVSAVFFDGRNREISRISLGRLTPAERNNEARFFARHQRTVIPPGTRRIVCDLNTEEGEGLADGFVDNISILLTERE